MIETSVLSLSDYEEWAEILPASRSVYGSREYAAVTSAQTGSHAYLFVIRGDAGSVVYPHFVRTICDLPGCPTCASNAVDIYSPEYTGPMIIGQPGPELIREFRDRFTEYACSHKIVSEFAHLHPWKSIPQCLDEERVSVDREIVYVNLDQSTEDLWAHSLGMHCRKQIRKAMRLGATGRTIESKCEIEKFYEIYIGTMKRRGAAESYYLPLDYFMSMYELLPHNAVFFLVEYLGRAIAGGLCLYDDDDVYAHMGGMDRDFEEVRPFNLLNYTIIDWGMKAGRKRLILGGGYRPGDGIFNFKATFSPLTSEFQVYRKVHDEATYEKLVGERVNAGCCVEDEVSFFPKYRQR